MWHTRWTVTDKENLSVQRETCPGAPMSTTGWLDIAPAVSCWPIIIKTWVQSQAIPCGICGSQIGNRTCFSPSTLAFPCQYLSNNLPHSHLNLPLTFHNLSKRDHCEQNTSPPPTTPLTNPTWTALELNPGLHSGTPVNNHLSYGTIVVMYVIPLLRSISFHFIILSYGLNTVQWPVHINDLHAFHPHVYKKLPWPAHSWRRLYRQ